MEQNSEVKEPQILTLKEKTLITRTESKSFQKKTTNFQGNKKPTNFTGKKPTKFYCNARVNQELQILPWEERKVS